MISDILIYETGSGGDFLLRGNGLATVSGYENSPYLSMFGGNDWWGNAYIPDGNSLFSAQTEDVLNTTPLTSAGRVKIENAIKADLAYLDDITGTTYTVSTSIANANRLDIVITINGKVFNYQWNPDSLYLNYIV